MNIDPTILTVAAILGAVLIAGIVYKTAKRFLFRRARAFLIAAAVGVLTTGLGIGAITVNTADIANAASTAASSAPVTQLTDWVHTTYGVDVNPAQALELIAGHPVELTVNGITQKVSLTTDVAGQHLTVANNELPTIG